MSILLSLLLLIITGCTQPPRYIQDRDHSLAATPRPPRGNSPAYEAWIQQHGNQTAAPRLTPDEEAKIRIAEQYLRLQQQQSAQQDDPADFFALQGMMNSVNVWTQQMHQQAPPMPLYQMPASPPIVIPRATNCTTTRNGTQLYTTCY